jgi:hypothetical protein
MKALNCHATRKRLEAFHDGELPISEQIAVSAHLEWCEACALSHDDLRLMRTMIRSLVPDRVVLSDDEEISFQTGVIGRARAEASVSYSARIRDMFEDMHFVYAGLGAVASVFVCAIITLGMVREAAAVRTAPLPVLQVFGTAAASAEMIIRTVPVPGSGEPAVSKDERVRMPRAVEERFATVARTDGSDAIVALAAVVTREGRVASLELLRDQGIPWITPGSDEATLVNEVLGAASEARFEPARVAGLPVAVNVVWIVAQTTVRGTPVTPGPVAPRPRAAFDGASPALPLQGDLARRNL